MRMGPLLLAFTTISRNGWQIRQSDQGMTHFQDHFLQLPTELSQYESRELFKREPFHGTA